MESGGAFGVAWHNREDVYVRLYDSQGAPSTDAIQLWLANDPTTTILTTHLAAFREGGYVVVWTERGSGSVNIQYAQRISSSGERVGEPSIIGGGSIIDVAAGCDGLYLTVFARNDGSEAGVKAFVVTPTDTTRIDVNATTLEAQVEPSIASDAQGNFVVAWRSQFQDGSRGAYLPAVLTRRACLGTTSSK